MKRATDPRHLARVLALQELFSKDFNKDSVNTDTIPLTELIELDEITQYDTKLYEKIKEGVIDNNTEIDSIITKYAPQWPLDQIKLVDLQILRIAIFEGFIGKITPPKVALDEAIEIAKEFGGETSSKFVNGVLGAIYEETNGKV
ncbi:MAG TPA: transcription antitermination factor NusB [Candidatus Dojkabacteria bacterium]|nr:transcription antitermination factor NusB [Candidatus Dojkabacteria bacterium]HOR06073.1 transcription antitermination factor NusB [Candidatus Dojkabacteria bacterium]HQI92657.1 transcription antitermination factor NusB [Candidatus Dojkabacteria bacterium]